jgi:UDP-glucuronate 4-epimerase
MNNTPKILITGTAGFIGFHLVEKLVKLNYNVIGLDIINDYYDVNLKYERLKVHGIEKSAIKNNVIINSSKFKNYSFIKSELSDFDFIVNFMIEEKFTYVINLAAQAGVRYSIENPREYTKSNIDGFLSILEGCKASSVKHLIYASSSSVYGLNTKMPLSEEQPTEHPMAMYAVTKKTNELMAHSYSHLFNIPTSGLRFFTVYGPWGRPDMALYIFAEEIIKNGKIKLFNEGRMIRDFTYVDDVVESISRLIIKPPSPNPLWDANCTKTFSSSAPFQLFNIGNSNPIKLIEYINEIEIQLNNKVEKEFLPMQAGDVPYTHSENKLLEKYIDFIPKTTIKEGIKKFTDWFCEYKNYQNTK